MEEKKSQWLGLHEKRGGTMEGNRDVEMGIDGEGMGVGGERGDKGD